MVLPWPVILIGKVFSSPGPRGLVGSSRCQLVANAEDVDGVSYVVPWDLDGASATMY